MQLPHRTATTRRPIPVVVVLLMIVAGVVWFTVVPDRDRRPSYTARWTAAELRERPDVTEVLPSHVDATRALLEAVGDTASVTWGPADAQVFVHQRDGKDEQVVDGRPVLVWKPEHWSSTEDLDLDESDVAALAETFREVLEPRGYSVSTADRKRPMQGGLFHYVASDEHGSSLQLVDVVTDGPLRVIALTNGHLYRSDTCDADPLACFPTVEDPAAGL